jgi:hypothetical protein
VTIGSFYDTTGVVTGQAMGLFAPANTPLPADSINVFDPTVWLTNTITVAGSSGTVTWSVGGVSTSALAYNAPAATVQAALQALTSVGAGNAVVALSGAVYTVTLLGRASGQAITAAGATGATATVVNSLWTPAGSTEQGWAFNYNVSTQNVNIEEQQLPVDQKITDSTLQVTANLSEDRVRQLSLAYGTVATKQAADPTHVQKTRLTFSTNLSQLAVALETVNTYGYARRYYIPAAVSAVNVGVTFRRAAAPRLIPVTFTSVCPIEQIFIDEVEAPHT